jgi:Concanavalin A-like lectin/glucanases superfamily
MKSAARNKHELTVLVMKSLVGDATASDLCELNRLVHSDPTLTSFFVDVVALDSELMWSIAKNRSGNVNKDLVSDLVEAIGPDQSRALERAPHVLGSESMPPVGALGRRGNGSRSRMRFSLHSLALASSALFIAGTFFGLLIVAQFPAPSGLPRLAALDARTKEGGDSSRYMARVVNATSCRWSTGVKFPVQNDGSLRRGESLQLVEGIAQIHLEWDEGVANLRIEGPAGLVLTADHGCSLSHGRLTAEVITNSSDARFSIDTPNGLVELGDGASAGVFVSGRNVSLHVFRGADVELQPWSTDNDPLPAIKSIEGESISLIEREDGSMDVKHGKCQESFFASQVSMYFDELDIPAEYVQDVRSHNPLLYWRFENDLVTERRVSNDVGAHHAGIVYGSVQQRERNGNGFVEFGASSMVDSTLPRIETEDDFGDEVQADYTLEVWIKPNHYHLGTIVSFFGKEPIRGDSGLIESPHGLLMEIGGPRTTQTTIEQPGKIRYLHRSPPSGHLAGTTCFSSQSYEPRKWQHVVFVKQGPSMRIYLDGSLVGSAEDKTSMAPGLKLLVGQLDGWRGARMYVGQLDELAFYPVALTADEILKHYRLVRPGADPARVERARKPSESGESGNDVGTI